MRASQKQIEIEKSQVFDSKGNKGFEQKVKIEPIGITIPESESEVESKMAMREDGQYIEESDCERREYRNYSYDEDSEFYDDRYDDGRHEDWRGRDGGWREEPDYYYRSSDKRNDYRADKRRDEYRRVYYQDEENDCFYDTRCYRSASWHTS